MKTSPFVGFVFLPIVNQNLTFVRGRKIPCLTSKMPSNKKKQSSTLPLMPSKETVRVKQELKLIAGALLKGSRLIGNKSFMIKTPALATRQWVYMMISNSLRLQTCCLPGTVLSHHVAKSLNVHLTIHVMIHPENMNPFTCSVQAVNHADEGQAFFFFGVTK